MSPKIKSETDNSEARKPRRVTKACDFCHGRSIRCRKDEDNLETPCRSCVDYDEKCTYNRVSKKRGIPSGTRRSASASNANSITASSATSNATHSTDSGTPSHPMSTWSPPLHVGQGTIRELTQKFFDNIYPIFPLFHRPSFDKMVARKRWQTERPFFAVLMAMCALVSARMRDGAFRPEDGRRRSETNINPSTFFQFAFEMIPEHTEAVQDIKYYQAMALLALTSLQDEKIEDMKFYTGLYFALARSGGLGMEYQWPKNVGPIEIQERRRLFWCMYVHDIHTSAVFGLSPQSRESLSAVQYPSVIDDEYITDHGDANVMSVIPVNPLRGTGRPHWLTGWNFTIELYRILEHVIDQSQSALNRDQTSPRRHFGYFPVEDLEKNVYQVICEQYRVAPEFRRESSNGVSNDYNLGYCDMQTARMVAATQLISATLASSKETSLEEKCHTVSKIIAALRHIFPRERQLLSTQLLCQLSAVPGIFMPMLMPSNLSDYHLVRGLLDELLVLEQEIEFNSQKSSWSGRLDELIHSIHSWVLQQGQHGQHGQHGPHGQHGERVAISHTVPLVEHNPPEHYAFTQPHPDAHINNPPIYWAFHEDPSAYR